MKSVPQKLVGIVGCAIAVSFAGFILYTQDQPVRFEQPETISRIPTAQVEPLANTSSITDASRIQVINYEEDVPTPSSQHDPMRQYPSPNIDIGSRIDLEQSLDQLSANDIKTLESLPPMCTSSLPGIDLSDQQHAVSNATRLAKPNYQSNGQVSTASKSSAVSSKGAKDTELNNLLNDLADSKHQHENQAEAEVSISQPEPRVNPGQAIPVQDNAFLQKSGGDFEVHDMVIEADNQFDQKHQQLSQLAKALHASEQSRSAKASLNPHRKATNINRAKEKLGATYDRIASTLNPHSSATPKANSKNQTDPDADPHLEIYSRSAFPSAKECATCHEQIYEEWASSSHAYASISPMFHAFENTINRLSQGTIGYFCLRCHAPVATTMGLRRDQAIWDGPRVFREGVTCVACHRVKTIYTKADGERRMEPGDVYDPVYGGSDGTGVDIANKYSQFFKVKTDPNDTSPGQAIHKRAIQFEELSESSFCMSCHQVAVKPGIKLEVVWDQYRASPAYRDGVTCQDCHTGKIPGVDGGYSVGPAAVVDNKVVNPERKHSNHMFYGPGYSIAHPGIFPDNLDADRWTVNQWLEFDWRAGWGTDAFEDALADGKFHSDFPPVWQNVDDRYDAREIVEENLKKLHYKKDLRRQVLENGSKVDGPFFAGNPGVGKALKFKYCVTNINPGHNMPSGSLGAQPQLWMNVVLIGPDGHRVWESGYVDSNGDLADNHSLDVLARRIPLDTQLFNLQTKFLTTNVKGTDREMYLPINMDIDQLPFLRPAAQPVSVLNHPPFIRMEGHSIPPLGSRNAKYVVPARLMQQPGTYRLSVRMRSRAEPIYFMRFCEATPEMEKSMNEWIVDFHTSSVAFEVH